MRASGRTTRCIDRAIQILFETGIIIIPTYHTVMDEREGYRYFKGVSIIDPDCIVSRKVQENLLFRILRRLELEHPNQYQLMQDEDVTSKKGIYEYILTGK